jgi:hypothetical protein
MEVVKKERLKPTYSMSLIFINAPNESKISQESYNDINILICKLKGSIFCQQSKNIYFLKTKDLKQNISMKNEHKQCKRESGMK